MNTFDFFVDGLDSIKIYRDEEYKSVVKNKVNQLNQMSVRDCNEHFFLEAWHTVWGKGSTGYSYTQCIFERYGKFKWDFLRNLMQIRLSFDIIKFMR